MENGNVKKAFEDEIAKYDCGLRRVERGSVQLYANMLAGAAAQRQRLHKYVQLDARINAAWGRLTAGTYTAQEFLKAFFSSSSRTWHRKWEPAPKEGPMRGLRRVERGSVQLYANMLAGAAAQRQRLHKYVQLDARINAAWGRLTGGTYTVQEFLKAFPHSNAYFSKIFPHLNNSV
ncbi:hypothetical protein U1Q18_049693 [Sarracenia purpurea var. burkii]